MLAFLKPKNVDVLSHWYALVPNFNTSTQEFYAAVERELKERRVPGLEISRVEFAEGGLLSAKREYLRMTRERLVFDVCAAPFGTDYFFSCRMAEIPAVVKFWQIGVLLVSGGVIAKAFTEIFSLWLGLILLLFVTVGLTYLMRNAVAMGLKDVDKTLLESPVLGTIYQRWFRKETYYRQDTRLIYLTIIPSLVKQEVEKVTAAKGVTLLQQYEHSPILRELYRPVTNTPFEGPSQSYAVG